MDLLCTCRSDGKDKKIECGSIAVDAVNIVAISYKAMVIPYTCREIEMLGFSGKLFVVRKHTEADGKEVKVLEVYV
jgi:hypothetical protein